ncbi:MAG: mycothione reductase [Jatrophihabitans sp.]|uniref:mycothione reductase n=1 Tax=Jatrophihabitans sp. TaxID=1932789 RepID=UPI003F812844
MPHHDLLILGSGSANSIVGPEFADQSVAIVERGTFGGTCLNVGCIPTKMYVYPADLARAVQSEAARLGVDATLDKVRWRDIRDRVFGRIDAISSAGRVYRAEGRNTTLYEATARFTGAHEVTLSTGEVLTAERIVIATGSRPMVPDVVRDAGVPFHTSDTVMRIDDLPEHVVILGGGYIAAEFGHVFSSFGSRVTVVARSAPLLRHLDREVADSFTAVAREHWDVRTGRTVTAVDRQGDGVRFALDDGAEVTGDLLLVATGRVPNTDDLDPGAAGVDLHPDGRVVVDEFQRTSVEGIWALGDVSSDFQLKHVANHEARIVQHNLLHPDDLRASDHRFVPAAVFTHPQIASVGLTEEQAAERGDYVAASLPYGSTAFGWAMDDLTSFCKLVADPSTGRLLGAHLLGEQAATLIQPLIQAMSFGLGVDDMARNQYWIHPALTEVVENALLQLRLP